MTDQNDDDFGDEIETPPTPEFLSRANDLQSAVDLAQANMRICAEPEFSRLADDLKRAKDALHDHYADISMNRVFAEGERADLLRLRQIQAKLDVDRENGRKRAKTLRTKSKSKAKPKPKA